MKLPKLTNLSVTDATVGDAHFPKVEALLPFNGTNGATSTTDLSDRGNTVTFANTAQISTAQSKFGGSSLLLDGIVIMLICLRRLTSLSLRILL